MKPETIGLSQSGILKTLMEENLRHHGTLTLGDHVRVYHRGNPFNLVVTLIQPPPAASLINTDVEFDLELPDGVAEAQMAMKNQPIAETKGDNHEMDTAVPIIDDSPGKNRHRSIPYIYIRTIILFWDAIWSIAVHRPYIVIHSGV